MSYVTDLCWDMGRASEATEDGRLLLPQRWAKTGTDQPAVSLVTVSGPTATPHYCQ